MADTPTPGRWLYRALYLVIAALIAFAQLLPVDLGAGQTPGPDVLLLLTLAWLIRRPDAVPVISIAVVFLAADLLFMRPPGLWAATVVIMTEVLRGRLGSLRDMGFALEWLVVAGYLAVATLAFTVVLAIFFVPQPAMIHTLMRLAFTILAYPLVIALGARAFGLRKPVNGEFNPLGGRA